MKTAQTTTQEGALESPNTKSSGRLVISWFGWDIGDMEILTEGDVFRWTGAFRALCGQLGFTIERLGGPIDLIVGLRERSVSHYNYYLFQREFFDMNDRLGFRLSGMLWLMDDSSQESLLEGSPTARYILGREVGGNWSGRPDSHAIK